MVSKHKKIHAAVGITLITASLLLIAVSPPNVAPEFSGTTTMRLSFEEEKTEQTLSAALAAFPYETAVELSAEDEYTITTQSLNDTEYITLKNAITDGVGAYRVIEYQSFSPSISEELVRKAFIVLLVAMAIIVAYISFAFRGVSRPVASWRYGVAAIVALVHDSIIPLGFFALLASVSSAAIDALFITALLATLGYSINDTIVVFDRVRERLRLNAERKRKETFEEVIDYGTRQSVRRSIYTSVSTMIPLALLCVFVPVTQWFALALFIGVLSGTYSSLFFAPSLLILWNRYIPQRQWKRKERTDTERAEEELRGMLRGSDVI